MEDRGTTDKPVGAFLCLGKAVRCIEKKKMGRLTTNSRTGQINVRLSERKLALLNECAERMIQKGV